MKKVLWILLAVFATAAVIFLPRLFSRKEPHFPVSSEPASSVDFDSGAALSRLQMTVGNLSLRPQSAEMTIDGERHHLNNDNEISQISMDFAEFSPVFSVQPISLEISVRFDDGILFSGSAEDLRTFVPEHNGDYTLFLTAEFDSDALRATASYILTLTIDSVQEITVSSDTVLQGNLLTVTARNVSQPTVSTSLAFEPHCFFNGTAYVSFIPVGYKTKPGDYTVSVKSAELSREFTVHVEKYDFDVQHMYIDEEIADNTVGSDTANWELYSAMKEPKALCDDTYYPEGEFLWPVRGEITTEFGMIRYVNDQESSSRHSGIDIAADEGTPIVATNNGRVVLAQFLQATGNTVVIEHGYGLKSIYYHMSELDCKVGDMVKKGDIIGKVGSTGFSTGPHLHFSMAVNTVWINPWQFIDESLRDDA